MKYAHTHATATLTIAPRTRNTKMRSEPALHETIVSARATLCQLRAHGVREVA